MLINFDLKTIITAMRFLDLAISQYSDPIITVKDVSTALDYHVFVHNDADFKALHFARTILLKADLDELLEAFSSKYDIIACFSAGTVTFSNLDSFTYEDALKYDTVVFQYRLGPTAVSFHTAHSFHAMEEELLKPCCVTHFIETATLNKGEIQC